MKRLLAYLFIVLGLGLTFNVSASIKCFNPETNKVETWHSYDYCPGNRTIYINPEEAKIRKKKQIDSAIKILQEGGVIRNGFISITSVDDGSIDPLRKLDKATIKQIIFKKTKIEEVINKSK